MLKFCSTFDNVDEKMIELPQMSCVTFSDYLEQLCHSLERKTRNGSPKGIEQENGQSQQQITSASETEISYPKFQLMQVQALHEKLKRNPFQFDLADCRKQLKKLNLLREFDEIVKTQQNEYEHLVTDLNAVDNFILSSRYYEKNHRGDSENHAMRLSTKKSMGQSTFRLFTKGTVDNNLFTPSVSDRETVTWSKQKGGVKRSGSSYKVKNPECEGSQKPLRNRTSSCSGKIDYSEGFFLLSSQMTFLSTLAFPDKTKDSRRIYGLWLYSRKKLPFEN